MDEDDPGDKFLNGHVTDVGVYFDDKPYSLLEILETTYVPLSIHSGLLNRLAIDVHVAVERMRTQVQRDLQF